MPQAQTKDAQLHKLHERLFTLRETENGVLNEIAAQTIKRETLALEAHDPVIANTILGILECLKGNKEYAQKHHNMTLQLLPDAVNYYQYSVSMAYLGYYQEAYDLIKKSIQKNDTLPLHLYIAMEVAHRSGHPQAALNYYQKWVKLKPNEKNEESLMQKIHLIKQLLAAGIKDKDLAEITGKVEQVCHEFNACIVKSWLMDDPEVEHDYCDWLYVDQSVQVVEQMADALWKKLDTDQGPPNLYIHGYIPIFCSALEEEDSQ